ncbi:MAG: DUF1653 domain-containing protein [Candidatus Kerfeldbacteria bacterium]|nr:DUF1653 domain-containing protein [Candidatus Kerfeldbacteria bacterium]
MEPDVRPGLYQHYKGGAYEVIGLARHSETKEAFVVYQAVSRDHRLWIRPAAMFLQDVTVDGKTMPRFRLIDKQRG